MVTRRIRSGVQDGLATVVNGGGWVKDLTAKLCFLRYNLACHLVSQDVRGDNKLDYKRDNATLFDQGKMLFKKFPVLYMPCGPQIFYTVSFHYSIYIFIWIQKSILTSTVHQAFVEISCHKYKFVFGQLRSFTLKFR